MLSGWLAAESVKEAIDGRNKIDIYKKRLWKEKWYQLAIHTRVQRLLMTLTDHQLDEIAQVARKLFHNKTYHAIDSIEFVKKLVLKHPKILLKAKQLFLPFR